MNGWICGRCNASIAPWSAVCPICSPGAQGGAPPAQHPAQFAQRPAEFYAPEPTPAPVPQGPPRYVEGDFPIGATAADPASEVRLPKGPPGSGSPGANVDGAGDVTLDTSWLDE